MKESKKWMFYFLLLSYAFLIIILTGTSIHTNAQTLQWVCSIGSANIDKSLSVVTDKSGNVYITGCFKGTVDFDPGPALYNLTSVGGSDIFVCKMDGNGHLLWAKAMGGVSEDVGNDIAVDIYGNVYTTGFFYFTVDFDPGPGVNNLTADGKEDIFVSKLDSSGNFVWVKMMGGVDSDIGTVIAVDTNRCLYIGGTYEYNVDLNPGPVYQQYTAQGKSDVFVVKLDSLGNYMYSKSFGTFLEDGISDIILDKKGNYYIAGYNFGLTNKDGYISKFSLDGSPKQSIVVGGPGYDYINKIAVDYKGNVYACGNFSGLVDFDPDVTALYLTSSGDDDIFIAKWDSSGHIVWAKAIQGPEENYAYGIAVDGSEQVFCTGSFKGTTDFDPDATGIYNLSSVGGSDIFICKLNFIGDLIWAHSTGDIGWDEAKDIILDENGSIYCTGTYMGTVDFDPGMQTYSLSSAGSIDAYIQKFNMLTGLEVDLSADKVYIYPNPSTGVIYFEGVGKGKIELFNMVGVKILSEYLNNRQVDYSTLPEGVYVITISTEKATITKKIILRK